MAEARFGRDNGRTWRLIDRGKGPIPFSARVGERSSFKVVERAPKIESVTVDDSYTFFCIASRVAGLNRCLGTENNFYTQVLCIEN